MTFVNKTLDVMLEEIKFEQITRDDTLIPEDNPIEFVHHLGILCPDDRYIYALLNEVAGEESKVTADYYGAIAFALENAFTRGNQGRWNLPVTLRVYSGQEGHVVRIADNGKGFNYRKKINQLRAGESYTVGNGYGMERLDGIDFEVSYEKRGSIINIMMKDGQPDIADK